MISKILTTVAGPLFEVIDKAITDKDQANALKKEIQEKLIDQQDSRLNARMKVLLAELQGESWLQRNWRPLLMTTIVAIVANNYLLAPYLGAMFGVGLSLDLPPRLWDLMAIGVGGYLGGRTVKKSIEGWKGKPKSFLDEVDK